MPKVTHWSSGRLATQVQRLGRMVPAPIRGGLGEVLSHVDRRPFPSVDDWSRPLVGGPVVSGAVAGGGIDVLTGNAIFDRPIGVSSSPRWDAVPGEGAVSGPRCLLATTHLDVGGLDEVVAFLARKLPLRGFRTAVLHASAGTRGNEESQGRLGRMLRECGVEVIEADENAGPGRISEWAPDVISAHGAPAWVFATAERSGVPFVDNLHGMYSVFGADWSWHRDASHGKALAAVVVVSDLVRRDYLECNPDFPPGRVALIPNGVDAERRSGGDRATARERLGLTGEYLFLSLARHSLQKNTYGLISAFGELAQRRPEAHLVIAGRPDDTRYFKKVLELRDNLGCRDRIHLRDHAMTPAALLAAADGFVLDSFFEGWPLASMEALFSGLPVVLSDVGGAREQVGDDPARGYVVANPLGDPFAVNWGAVAAARYRQQANRDEFVAGMDCLIADREQYLASRDELAAESAQRFRLDKCLDLHAAVLSAAAAGQELPATVIAASTAATGLLRIDVWRARLGVCGAGGMGGTAVDGRGSVLRQATQAHGMTAAPTTPNAVVAGSESTPVDHGRQLSSSVRSGAIWNLASTLLLRLSGIVVTAVVAHILDPRDFGIFAVASTAFAIISSLGEFGVSSCLVRADLDLDLLAPTMATVSLITSLLFAGVMVVWARPIASVLGSSSAAGPVKVMALTVIVVGIVAVPTAQCMRDFKQDKIFLANVLSFIPSTIILLVMAKSGSGAMAFAWSRLGGQITSGIVILFSVQRNYLPGLSRRAFTVLYEFGIPMAAANFIGFILLNVDYALVGRRLGPSQLGTYVLAYNVASWSSTLLSSVINSVSIPAFSRVRHDEKLLRDAIDSGIRAVSIIAMPMCALLMVTARPLVLTIYGARWEHAAPVLSVLSIYGVISVICLLFSGMLTGLGRSKFVLVVQIVWLAALFPAMTIGVRHGGIVGAATAHILVIVPIVFPSYLIALKRATGFRVSALVKGIFPSLSAAVVAGLVARLALEQFSSPLLQLIAGILAGGVAYAAAIAPHAVVVFLREKSGDRRIKRVLRAYYSAGRMAGLQVGAPPKHASPHRRGMIRR
jgi:lipopolysaccharide exporter